MSDVLNEMVFDFGPIAKIVLFSVSEMPTATSVGITFESGAVEFRADPDDDSLVVHLWAGEVDDNATLLAEDPWPEIVGGNVSWAWVLRNNNGYEDGAQLLIETLLGTEIFLQMTVWASAIRCVTFGGEVAR